ncbi:integrase/recombinase [Advenella kashmirensis WT001]|uniref:Integrase/recombinase n=2 Tax=Advenella kashmirensis TaxID=310575 RepID=I3UD41_ADVKW|nr:integrase/recombinase [Advenella kashmirensis WT001]
MASIQKTKNGYRVQVSVKGVRTSASFPTKRECVEWAGNQVNAVVAPAAHKTFRDLLEKYRDEVSAKKKGARWEEIRINKLLAEEADGLAGKMVGSIGKADIAQWRDKKIQSGLSGASIVREWAIISNAFNVAIREWDWLTVNPMAQVKKPPGNPPRERLITDKEIELLDHVTGYSPESSLETVTQRVGAALHFALETAMRAQEICLLRWDDISGRVAKVNTSKTRSGIRQVPLSRTAAGIVERLAKVNGKKETVFEVSTTQLDALFRKARAAAGLEGFTFHDSRRRPLPGLPRNSIFWIWPR